MKNEPRYDFSDQVVLVTGGGTGIGRGIAEAFVNAGATVVACGRREAPLQDFKSRNGPKADWISMDITSTADRERAIADTIDRHGRLDVLVNNAYLVWRAPFEETTSRQIDEMYSVLLGAPTMLMQLALPHLIVSKGRIINISSVGARYIAQRTAGLAVYAAAKAGLNQLTRSLAVELGFKGVRVNGISPGPTQSETSNANPAAVSEAAATTPLGRIGQPTDIAAVALFLASSGSDWVTGQIVEAAGGWGLGG